jgi:hypothetical protein
LICELEGCQKAVDLLTEYYDVRGTRIRLNSRKVGKEDIAVSFENKAHFTKRGLTKRTVLHELDHHLAYVGTWKCLGEQKKEGLTVMPEIS